MEIAGGAVDALRRRLAGEAVAYTPAAEAVRHTEQFLTSLSLETTDLGTIGPRLVRLCHALDHLTELDDDLTTHPARGRVATAGGIRRRRPRAGRLGRGGPRLPRRRPDAGVLAAVERAALQLREERKSGRERLLEDIALQRTPAGTARAGLDALVVGRRRALPRLAAGGVAARRGGGVTANNRNGGLVRARSGGLLHRHRCAGNRRAPHRRADGVAPLQKRCRVERRHDAAGRGSRPRFHRGHRAAQRRRRADDRASRPRRRGRTRARRAAARARPTAASPRCRTGAAAAAHR